MAAAGALLVPAGTQLSPPHIGMLICAGLVSVDVVQRPRVRIVVSPKNPEIDGNGPMIRGLVQRDGGVIADMIAAERTSQGIRNALEADGVDIVLVIGGTGPGTEDHAAAALAAAGELAIHGIALRPGETTGLGHTRSGVPVALLAGSPAACLFGYEMLAGRAVRRLGGRNPELPYRSAPMHTRRKIVSADRHDRDLPGSVQPAARCRGAAALVWRNRPDGGRCRRRLCDRSGGERRPPAGCISYRVPI